MRSDEPNYGGNEVLKCVIIGTSTHGIGDYIKSNVDGGQTREQSGIQKWSGVEPFASMTWYVIVV